MNSAKKAKTAKKATPSITIGIDHGNGNIKTAHEVFPADIKRYYTKPDTDEDILEYQGRFYIPAARQIIYEDKTENEDYLISTLIAIGRELKIRKVPFSPTQVINLGVGLPPGHMNEKSKKGLVDYLKGSHTFKYEGKEYHVVISSVKVFPQGLAAAITDPKLAKELRYCILDIGAGTIEYIGMKEGKVDPDKRVSLNIGVNVLSRKLVEQIKQDQGTTIEISDIEYHLSGRSCLSSEIGTVIDREFTDLWIKVLVEMKNHGMDPKIWKIYLLGGGGPHFENFLKAAGKKLDIIREADIRANAIAYEKLVKSL